MRHDQLKALNAARRSRRAVVTLTDPADGSVTLFEEGSLPADGPGPLLEKALQSGKSGLVEHGDRSLFVNVYLPPLKIVVIGAVHISQALARMATIAGFDLSIIDPRSAFATEERFRGVNLTADWPEDVLAGRPLDRHTALVAVTHDPKIDDFPLMEALRAGCFYVGALGSRKTHAKRVDRLREAGFSEETIVRIKAPIGLDIGAATPAEIAVAILGEIISAYRRRAVTGLEGGAP